MATTVTGDRYMSLDGQLFEIKRQLRQPNGYPYNLEALRQALQDIIEGIFKYIFIDRSRPFNPAEFVYEGWSIWKGPADGDGLSGEDDQDERSLALTKVDMSTISLVTMLKRDGTQVRQARGEEKLRRLREAGYIRLDAKIFQTLWENKEHIPEGWKGEFVYSDGTILRSPDGGRHVLCLCWLGDKWYWFPRRLVDDWGSGGPSAVLAR